ncbi:DUF4168 domain-containing protein [Geminocystis herdmanii]|uniref:DUF4168 domain-containing protein n=1 Tax=Geminocystis herdmanii TaxID=669359 RepID=UPI00034B140F|nr:DUF4168 domain-containing protein [Geminocystis herdmanii]
MLVNNYSFSKTVYQILILLGLSTGAIVFGVIPEINSQTITFNNHVVAQSVSDGDLKKYAQAAIEIENLRVTTLSNIESIVGKSKPSQLNCYQENTFNQLPSNARNIAENYCQQSEAIVKKHGLTNTQFNQIHQQVRNNPTLKQKVQTMIGQM